MSSTSSSTRHKRKRPDSSSNNHTSQQDDATADPGPSPRRRRQCQSVTENPGSASAAPGGDSLPGDDNATSSSDPGQNLRPAGSDKDVSMATLRDEEAAEKADAASAGRNGNIRPTNNGGGSDDKDGDPAGVPTSPAEAAVKEDGEDGESSGVPSTQRQALHEAAASSPVSGTDRVSRLRDLVAHRSMLLERVQVCRAAAEQRLRGLAAAKTTAATTTVSSSTSEAEDRAEMAAFRELTKQANLSVRRNSSRATDGDATAGVENKRMSLSLRRGSSVGKKMNAALSSLVPHSNLAASTVVTAGATTDAGGRALDAQVGTGTANTLSVLPEGSLSTAGPGQLSDAVSTLQQQQKRARSPNKKTGDVTTAAPPCRMDSNPSVDMGGSLSVKNLGSQQQQQNQQPRAPPRPRVFFPEAMALREERDSLQAKLRALLEKQQQRQESRLEQESLNAAEMMDVTEDLGSQQISPSSFANATTKSTNKRPLAKKFKVDQELSTELDIPPPAPLPTRRRTQWDAVLEEMSWLATDFREERKWKASLARLLAADMSSHPLLVHAGGTTTSISSITAAPFFLKADKAAMNQEATEAMTQEQDQNTPMTDDETGATQSKLKNSVKRKHDIGNEKLESSVYARPSHEDIDAAKKSSRVVSSMILGLEEAIRKGGSLEEDNKYHDEALRKFEAVRAEYLGKDASPLSNHFIPTADDSKRRSDYTDEAKEELILDSITDHVDQLHKVAKSRHKFVSNDFANALSSRKINFNAGEKSAVERVDKLWGGSPCAGAVLMGPAVSGKTFAAATILWKYRAMGAQLLVCPPKSVIRWRHELCQFSNLRVVLFGMSGGISNPDFENDLDGLDESDVVVCDYDLLSRIKNACQRGAINFASVVVDFRHPHALLGSMGVTLDVSSDDCSGLFPISIRSSNWWDDLIELAGNKTTRCLFIEFSGDDGLSLSKSGLTGKEQVEILAKRAACIIGLNGFKSSAHPITRQVICWARKKGKREVRDKFLRVRKVLSEAIAPLHCPIETPIVESSDVEWDLRCCQMPKPQRSEYERHCSEIRGVLSSRLYDGVQTGADMYSSISAVSSALVHLRRLLLYPKGCKMPHCHAIRTLEDDLPDGSRTSEDVPSLGCGRSPAQPDIEVMVSLLAHSAKLQELVSILLECGYEVAQEAKESLEALLSTSIDGNRNRDFGGGRPKKVAILAVLPEVQFLVSSLLTCIGVQNEMFFSCQRKSSKVESRNTNLAGYIAPREAALWGNWQLVLSRFCNLGDTGVDNESRDVDVVVMSPLSLGSWNSGLGIEGADLVVSLDDDWSGRNNFIVDALARRFLARGTLFEKDVELIRLVCANTVESKIFENASEELVLQRLDINGHLAMPAVGSTMKESQHSEEARSGFSDQFSPLNALLQMRGHLLSAVLVTADPVSAMFRSGSPVKFLPRLEAESVIPTPMDKESEAILVVDMMRREHSVSSLSLKLAGQNGRKVPLASLTPLGLAVPKAFMTRRDLPMVPALLHLEALFKGPEAALEDTTALVHLSQLTESSFEKNGDGGSLLRTESNLSSLLFYNDDDTSPRGKEIDRRRCNAYTKVFNGSWDGISVRDGNQGSEPLVFFPPLFPLLLEASKRPRVDSKASRVHNELPATDEEHNYSDVVPKRKMQGVPAFPQHPPNGKRPRLLNDPSPAHDLSHSKQPQVEDGCLDTENSTAVNGEQTKDLSEPAKKNLTWNDSVSVLDDDFGLIGSGEMVHPVESALFSAKNAKEFGASAKSHNEADFVSYHLPCDREESDALTRNQMDKGMNYMLLFVKKRRSSNHGRGLSAARPLTANSRLVSFAGNFVPAAGPFAGRDINGDDPKKGKKSASQTSIQMATTAFTRVPGTIPQSHPRQRRGDFRHQVLNSYATRRGVSGLSMFESISYKIASIRVESRVLERMERLMWKSTMKSGSGPGLPMQLTDSERTSLMGHGTSGCMRIVQLPQPGAHVGDLARTIANAQRSLFQNSMVLPRRVDFGPFQTGFLASPTGMTQAANGVSRIGVSLPMGVKVTQATREQNVLSWTPHDGKLLEEAAKRFGGNWKLLSHILTGLEGIVLFRWGQESNRIKPSMPRSSSQCRDSWQMLIRSQPSIASEILDSNTLYRNGLLNVDKSGVKDQSEARFKNGIAVLSNSSLYVQDGQLKADDPTDAANANSIDTKDEASRNQADESRDMDQDGAMTKGQPPQAEQRRSFPAINMAAKRKEVIQIPIPGVAAGDPPGHPVPSHPSHMHSVQASMTAQWAQGRTEMWPLQILDLADKQRAHVASSGSTSRRQHSTTSAEPAHHPHHPPHQPYHHHHHHRHLQHGPPTSQHLPPARAPPVYPSVQQNNAGVVRAAGAGRPAGGSPPQRNPQHQTISSSTAEAYVPPPSPAGRPKVAEQQQEHQPKPSIETTAPTTSG